eukprot:TRINITY_DN46828_c0_g1_i1.p1 TRINITY_DN46828_c0_g1~~TRINITY_DN46828_c0_g1_i1.p1  ORF type:complete len:263 (+),score=22.49 TRINITY_DN46828_c0_g1_i1:258-1046(+)
MFLPQGQAVAQGVPMQMMAPMSAQVPGMGSGGGMTQVASTMPGGVAYVMNTAMVPTSPPAAPAGAQQGAPGMMYVSPMPAGAGGMTYVPAMVPGGGMVLMALPPGVVLAPQMQSAAGDQSVGLPSVLTSAPGAEGASELGGSVSAEPPVPVDVDLSRTYKGTVREFDQVAGFGFVYCSELYAKFMRDVFIHRNQFTGLQIGDEIEFRIQLNSRGQPQVREPSFLRRPPPKRKGIRKPLGSRNAAAPAAGSAGEVPGPAVSSM